ncbi:MAG: 3-methyl-2-oxobutanoate hydroxymethyltransferase [Pseudopedobacter saltans]|uniref:3-methyl-2-oxobutanoate hydroxymethyltransferase n=1 Tax=Pseudopedobacter saltans TaxID=151895 RepID=A0A2W5F0T1_9SPHI|nr:MAG: 3-methyl-2-oxobutanoate hydroxymethyltransferase [Pseudopedobacter saltans]
MVSYVSDSSIKKITVPHLQKRKQEGKKISMLTCYDYTMASILDKTGIDIILVGDSAANVMAGYETTLPITLDQMIYHCASVKRAISRALLVVDLPFGSYQGSKELALQSSFRMMKEGGASALKLEGGSEIVDTIQTLVKSGIPVMGHLGLTPQSVNQFGGYGLRAKEDDEAERLILDAFELQKAGVFAIVLEKIPAELAAMITEKISIPIIGIGAGNRCDGQVLVLQDMLGLNTGMVPKFVRKYVDLSTIIDNAVKSYIEDVQNTNFPNEKESY